MRLGWPWATGDYNRSRPLVESWEPSTVQLDPGWGLLQQSEAIGGYWSLTPVGARADADTDRSRVDCGVESAPHLPPSHSVSVPYVQSQASRGVSARRQHLVSHGAVMGGAFVRVGHTV